MTSKAPVPTLEEEKLAWAAGYRLIAGIDEVGRGCLAGPVAAGAVILPLDKPEQLAKLSGVRDSKLLLPNAREREEANILEVALGAGFGLASVAEIDALGIVPSTRLAMQRAVEALPLPPDFLLIDALLLPDLDIPQKAIINGDELCLSIAAASVVAKVGRDRLMIELDASFPGYGFAKHKGYGTRQHQAALRDLGACAIHRTLFVRNLLASSDAGPEPNSEAEE
jgi:ribonuclease HII